MSDSTRRITTENIYVEYLPNNTAEATHVQHLYFDSDVDGGTFKLWVNGETTAAITMTGTAATDVAAIQSALDALPNLEDDDIVVSGSDIADITLTATGLGNAFVKIQLVTGFQDTLTQTSPNSNPKVQTEVTTQGSAWFQLSSDMSAMDWEESSSTVDVTAINEIARTEIPVDESVSGSFSAYKTRQGTSLFKLLIRARSWGILRIFPEGKIVGKEVISCQILIDSANENYQDKEKVEQEMSFQRQGEWINPPYSVWRG
jgi:hypothetical protein